MIAWRLILEAAVITGVAVALAALLVRWDVRPGLAAAVGSFLLILAWRAIGNRARWNDDFVSLISVGDVGCLVAGAAVPAMLTRTGARAARSLVPAVVGGVVGFVVNVAIL